MAAVKEMKLSSFYGKACAIARSLCLLALVVSVFGRSRSDGWVFAQTEKAKVSNETKPDCVIAKTWDERSQSWIWLATLPGRRVLGAEKKEEQANKDCMKYLRLSEKWHRTTTKPN